MRLVLPLVLISATIEVVPAFAHPGGLDASGGHHDRKHGGYHTHRSSGYTPPLPSAVPSAVSRTPSVSASFTSGRGASHRTAARTTAKTSAVRQKATAPPEVLQSVLHVKALLEGQETKAERNDAIALLDEISTAYEGTPEASEALRLLRLIRADEERERLEQDAVAERERRESDAASKLHLARTFMAARKTAHAKKWLEDLIRSYPETAAAKEGAEMLVGLGTASSGSGAVFGAKSSTPST